VVPFWFVVTARREAPCQVKEATIAAAPTSTKAVSRWIASRVWVSTNVLG
jgi:hypothetical protein